MTDTDLATASVDAASSNGAAKRADARRNAGLSGMVLTELRALAAEVGIKGTSGLRKGDLIAAIQASQAAKTPGKRAGEKTSAAAQPEPAGAAGKSEIGDTAVASVQPERRQRRGAARRAGAPEQTTLDTEVVAVSAESSAEVGSSGADASVASENNNDQRQRRDRGNQNRDNGQNTSQNRVRNNGTGGSTDDSNDEDGRGRRGRRFRDRRGRGRTAVVGETREADIAEDDVLQPVAGILDVLDNYAFVRTSGYLSGPNDVYVSMNLVRKNGLRRGDAITGAVRVPREGDPNAQRQKFNPLVRLDTVNGGDVETSRKRPDFGKLTPLYPNQRLRLETQPHILTTRIIDLVMPIGKGQRALIVSPPKAGKTSVLQAIANAIAVNNPECYLMVVLVDERPEEVTDMQRSVKGEVIASTFDRPPSDHTSVAELAIERAKRLVEDGKDVVVLLDSITRLGRAYNNSSPASGRILSGGVDSTALYPPKRFLGAARNIENGGSLTIIATAMVETGSTGDTVIFEEFKGTGNAELKLDRKIAERRVFPAVDVNPSGTRKDELLLSPDEAAIVHKLRRVLSGLDSHQAIDLLIAQLKKTKNNMEFLIQVSKTAPGAMGDD
ncbi:MAG: transcription termination factor Rho [Mycobacteriaceae bacterium]